MAKTRTPPLPDPDGIVAAAIPLKGLQWGDSDPNRTVDQILTGNNAAAQLAWHYLDKIPELHYITQYVGNALSQARLFIGEAGADPYNPAQVGPRHPANDLLASWAGGIDGQSEILSMLGLHLTLTGDSIVAGPDGTTTAMKPPFDQWRVFSSDELVSRGNGQILLRNPDGREQPLPKGVMPFRVWRPHPRWYWQADSPTRSCFTVLRAIELLDQHEHATLISRLISAGLLLLPDDITFPATEVETAGVQVDPFVRMFTEVASIAIKNRESAAALVPVTLRGPADALAQVRTIDFWTKLDDAVPAFREVALRRLGLGMDIPPEVLLGMAQSNSWSAWQTDESTVRMHIQPLMTMICGAITQGWLRPALEALPEGTVKNPENLVVWFDLSNLRVRPNQASEAQAAYDRFEADGDVLRLSSGLAPDSAPSQKELTRQVLLSVIKSDPAQSAAAINALVKLGYLDPKIGEFYDITRLGPVQPEPAPGGGPPGAVSPTAAPADGTPSEAKNASEKTPPPPSTPGKRSQDKQFTPPKATVGDPNHNNSTPGS